MTLYISPYEIAYHELVYKPIDFVMPHSKVRTTVNDADDVYANLARDQSSHCHWLTATREAARHCMRRMHDAFRHKCIPLQ